MPLRFLNMFWKKIQNMVGRTVEFRTRNETPFPFRPFVWVSYRIETRAADIYPQTIKSNTKQNHVILKRNQKLAHFSRAPFGIEFDEALEAWVPHIVILNAPSTYSQPLNQFSSFLSQNVHCNVVLCTFNSDWEIRLPNGPQTLI